MRRGKWQGGRVEGATEGLGREGRDTLTHPHVVSSSNRHGEAALQLFRAHSVAGSEETK